jgi:hypothetical protein
LIIDAIVSMLTAWILDFTTLWQRGRRRPSLCLNPSFDSTALAMFCDMVWRIVDGSGMLAWYCFADATDSREHKVGLERMKKEPLAYLLRAGDLSSSSDDAAIAREHAEATLVEQELRCIDG